MSLVICSSAQDKYQSVGNLVSNDGQVLPTSVIGPGLQNPAQFTNNINPVMTIPANSEVALKDISFYKSSVFNVGKNVSMGLWIGELLRGRWGAIASRRMEDVTSGVIRVPIQEGTYNPSTFADMLEDMLNQYVSYPDLFGNITVRPWSATGSTSSTNQGFIFNFQKGENIDQLVNRRGSTIYACPSTSNFFAYDAGTKIYTNEGAGFANNIGIITDMPLSLNGGEMQWDVSNCTGGWRISLTRPITPNKPKPLPFKTNRGQLTWDDTGYADIVLEYATRTDNGYTDTENTFRIFHSVYGIVGAQATPRFQYKEVEYYNNVDTDFTPNLDSYWVAGVNPAPGLGEDHFPMYLTRASTLTDLVTAPLSVSIKVFGEDTRVSLTRAATATPWDDAEVLVMTDSRLCVASNSVLAARTPTKNRFIKPTGTTTHALYPKISLFTLNETAQLLAYSGIAATNYQYPLDGRVIAGAVGATGPTFPASITGKSTSGSSYYGMSAKQTWGKEWSQNADLIDNNDPYIMDGVGATVQKQYVGLDGPTGNVPPVRLSEGAPFIPATAVGTGAVAYSVGLITIPTTEKFDYPGQLGVYVSDATSDVSELLGFSGVSFVGQTLIGSQYLYADRPTAASLTDPTNTIGAFWGWNVGSTSVPRVESGGSVFVRCPTLTHQSFNFGKGIPSKIIATIPGNSLDNSNKNGEGFFAPSEMTYLTLNNTEPLNFNDLTIELVDKNERILEYFDRNTTVTLHFRKER